MSTRYHASCDDCGFDRAYDSRARATYALRRHSCARHLARAASRARRLEREAAVDRVPKPCRHKQVTHEHGTRACYVLDRCRCRPCSRANAEAEAWRERQKVYGRYDRYVDAEPVRQHVHQLMAGGMGLKRIAAVSGVPHGGLWKLLYGKIRPGGTRHRSERVLRTTADRLLGTDLDLADGAQVSAYGTATRLRALVAIGYSISILGDRLGIARANMRRPMDPYASVTMATARATVQLYEALSMTPAIGHDHRSRISVSRARRYARERGWLPPLALDDAALDDPTYTPDDYDAEGPELDETAIFRRERGDRSVRLSAAEATELVHRWIASGRSLAECQRLTGVNPHRYLKEAA